MEQVTPGSKFNHKNLNHNNLSQKNIFKVNSIGQLSPSKTQLSDFQNILDSASKFCTDFNTPSHKTPFYNVLKLYITLDLDLSTIQDDAILYFQAKQYRKKYSQKSYQKT